jgi:hypothetical protein
MIATLTFSFRYANDIVDYNLQQLQKVTEIDHMNTVRVWDGWLERLMGVRES